MADRKETIAEMRRLADITDESSLCLTILHYARSGRATAAMIEAAISMVDSHLAYARERADASMIASAENLRAGLAKALIDGVKTLKQKKGPGPEFWHVEFDVYWARRNQGHRVVQQHKCATGVIDIYDLTTEQLIECKYLGTGSALGAAAAQLQRYRKSFPGTSLVIAVYRIEPDGEWLAEVLRREGYTILEMIKGQR